MAKNDSEAHRQALNRRVVIALPPSPDATAATTSSAPPTVIP